MKPFPFFICWVLFLILGIPVDAEAATVLTTPVSMGRSTGAMLLMLVIGGVGWLYGGLLGAVGFKLMHDVISSITPQYWTFWIGLFLVVLVLVGRDKLLKPWKWWA